MGTSKASHLPGRKVAFVQLGTSATAPAETLDISVVERRVVVSVCTLRRVMEAMINTRGRTKLSVLKGIYGLSPSCLPPPLTHLLLCFILFSLLPCQFETIRSSLHRPTVLPVTLLITVSSHKTFSLLRMKTSQRGLSLYLAGRMCNYAVPLGPQSHGRARDVTSCPSGSLCVRWFDPSSSFCLHSCLFAVQSTS